MAVEVTLRESAVGDHGADLWRHLIVHHKIPYGYLVLYEKGTVLQLRIIQVVTRPYDEYVLPTGARVRPCSAHTQLRAARGTSRAMCLRRGAATAAGLSYCMSSRTGSLSYCMSSRTGSLSYCMSSRIRVLDLSVVACQAVQPPGSLGYGARLVVVASNLRVSARRRNTAVLV